MLNTQIFLNIVTGLKYCFAKKVQTQMCVCVLNMEFHLCLKLLLLLAINHEIKSWI